MVRNQRLLIFAVCVVFSFLLVSCANEKPATPTPQAENAVASPVAPGKTPSDGVKPSAESETAPAPQAKAEIDPDHADLKSDDVCVRTMAVSYNLCGSGLPFADESYTKSEAIEFCRIMADKARQCFATCAKDINNADQCDEFFECRNECMETHVPKDDPTESPGVGDDDRPGETGTEDEKKEDVEGE